MTTKLISVARDFSKAPAGRYDSDGPAPGARFRDQYLLPALKAADSVTVDLDGTAGYGSSFLEEAFGGLVRLGFGEAELRRRLNILSARHSYEERVWNYIRKAAQTPQSP
jgi:hypothetical protein